MTDVTKRSTEEIRNRAKQLRADGLTYPQIAAKVGFSTGTVMAWCNENYHRYRIRMSKQRYDATTRGKHRCHNCGGPCSSGRRCRKCSNRMHSLKWTPEAVVNAIQQWAAEHDGTPPMAHQWEASLARRMGDMAAAEEYSDDDRWPTKNTVRDIFGSWNAALAQAGFQPRPRGWYDHRDTSSDAPVYHPPTTDKAR